MKTTKKRRLTTSKISAVQSNLDVNAGSTKVKTPIKEPCRRQRKKTGCSDTCSIGKNNHSPSKVQAVSEQHPVTGTCLLETTNCVLTPNQESMESQAPGRFKLQLFPTDVSTRKVLEKGGYNPHLELILSKQKKISSVLRHLKSKWGSVYNGGDIVLFPYNIQAGNIAELQRWTSDDTKIRAADVYEAIGSPTIFRLRYGWLTNAEPESFHPPTFSQFKDCLQNKSIKRGRTRDDEIAEIEKQLDRSVSKEGIQISTNGLPNATEDKFVKADSACEPMDNPTVGRGLVPPSSILGDSLTNISIGALLSEASLHATASQTDPVVARSDSSLQQIPFSCDSFDAAIAAHIYRHSQGSQRAPIASHTSFLDADETCHAFPCQKFASSGKDVITSSKSKPISSIQEENIEAGVTENQISPETKSDSPPHTQENICVSSSLGASGINWTDSLGPFDLSLSRQLTGAENISLSSFLATSLDAFQNFSLFGRDSNVARS